MMAAFELHMIIWLHEGYLTGRKMGLTSVSNEVFPEPLGPMSKKEGKVVADIDRYMTRCRNSGTESTRSAVIAMTNGEGPINEVSQPWGPAHDMM